MRNALWFMGFLAFPADRSVAWVGSTEAACSGAMTPGFLPPYGVLTWAAAARFADCSRPYPRTMSSALVVDDDPTVGDVVGAYLERAGFRVHRRPTAAPPWPSRRRPTLTSSCSTSCCPASDGWRCAAPAAEQPRVPVVMLTALGEEADRILGSRWAPTTT